MCCSDFLRVVMVAFNGIIFLAGAAILGVGIWVKVDSGSLLKILDQVDNMPVELNQIFYVGYLLIAVGSVLVLLGFLGCCGAIKKSPCMLLTFFVIVLLVFIAEVSGAIVVLVFKPLVDTLIEKIGTEAVQKIKTDYGKNPNLTELWNDTMDGLNCCGFHNYTDFTDSPFYNNSRHTYPQTCCKGSPCNLQSASTSVLVKPAASIILFSHFSFLPVVSFGYCPIHLRSYEDARLYIFCVSACGFVHT
ncbi:tetraspanin-1-like isoform X1 [Paramormyrops kingsleyae]|uniref:tetraspanin-1-like isoform X1 n=1 Tax=Paramormyrops kingsleyae TaxID=1676925 RepID=UPI000CD5DBF7|nr:tetraspanin-1-like isoform X1 [Paramormyrops kingsleyae]